MIIQYDTRPNATIDQKLRSLIESIQLALGEVGIEASNASSSTNTDMSNVTAAINLLSTQLGAMALTVNALDTITVPGIDGRVTTLETTTVPGIDGRVGTLENTTIPGIDSRVGALEGKIPAAPATDGAYVLTVTVTGGEPVYTWETA